ncbi:MAG TPA: nucleotidyltransferase family protein, partial [Methylibium sp.]
GQFPATLGDGSRWGLSIRYSMEGRDHGGALETAGGIAKALPWLTQGGAGAFWVVSGDIYAPDFRFDAELAARFAANPGLDAHLWLVPNPPFHPAGDFGLGADGLGLAGAGPDGKRWTYGNLALIKPSLVRDIAPGTRAALGPLLYQGMNERRIAADIYTGRWENIGTPAQLEALNRGLAA